MLLYALLEENRQQRWANNNAEREHLSMFPKAAQPYTYIPMSKGSFMGCPSQEVWPTTSVLSLGLICVWIRSIPPCFSPPRGLESLCPVFLHFLILCHVNTLFCKWLVFADCFFLSILKELLALWKTSAQNIGTSDKTRY